MRQGTIKRRLVLGRRLLPLIAAALLTFGVAAAMGAVRHFVGGPKPGTERVRKVSFEVSGRENRFVSDFRMRGVLVSCDDGSRFRWPPAGFAKYGKVHDVDVASNDGVFFLRYDSPHPEPKTYHYTVRGNLNSKGTRAQGLLRVQLKIWQQDGGQVTTLARCGSAPVPWVARIKRR